MTSTIFTGNILQTKDTDYYFAGEYVTPVKTLYNMHISMIAGLSYDQMMLQRKDLVDQLKGILNTASKRDTYKEKCGIIEFDGIFKTSFIFKLHLEKMSFSLYF